MCLYIHTCVYIPKTYWKLCITLPILHNLSDFVRAMLFYIKYYDLGILSLGQDRLFHNSTFFFLSMARTYDYERFFVVIIIWSLNCFDGPRKSRMVVKNSL